MAENTFITPSEMRMLDILGKERDEIRGAEIQELREELERTRERLMAVVGDVAEKIVKFDRQQREAREASGGTGEKQNYRRSPVRKENENEIA